MKLGTDESSLKVKYKDKQEEEAISKILENENQVWNRRIGNKRGKKAEHWNTILFICEEINIECKFCCALNFEAELPLDGKFSINL